LALAAGLEAGQKHPLALAVLAEAAKRNVSPVAFEGTPQGFPGKGIAFGEWRLGSADWAGVKDIAVATPGASVIVLCDGTGPVARFELGDTLRAGAQELIDSAKAVGIQVCLLSGDHPVTVAWWAQQLGIEDFRGGALPEEKHGFICALQEQGRTVWAVGDGINDAPQLAQADVSVAVGSGAPLAQAGADIVLTSASLMPLAMCIQHAKKTRAVIRQNLGWAFVYNVTAIPIAAMGWVNPWVAGIGMALSSLGVTLNAWRLREVSPSVKRKVS
jgi:Cu2+-exporting ATPase